MNQKSHLESNLETENLKTDIKRVISENLRSYLEQTERRTRDFSLNQLVNKILWILGQKNKISKDDYPTYYKLIEQVLTQQYNDHQLYFLTQIYPNHYTYQSKYENINNMAQLVKYFQDHEFGVIFEHQDDNKTKHYIELNSDLENCYPNIKEDMDTLEQTGDIEQINLNSSNKNKKNSQCNFIKLMKQKSFEAPPEVKLSVGKYYFNDYRNISTNLYKSIKIDVKQLSVKPDTLLDQQKATQDKFTKIHTTKLTTNTHLKNQDLLNQEFTEFIASKKRRKF